MDVLRETRIWSAGSPALQSADPKVNQADRSILSSVLKSPGSVLESVFYLQSNAALLLWRNLLNGVNSQAWQDKPWESRV